MEGALHLSGAMTTAPMSQFVEGQSSVVDFLSRHIWVAVLVSVVLLAVVVSVVFTVQRLRHRARYDYTALYDDMAAPAREANERKQRKEEIRDRALLQCSFYLRSRGTYTLIDHLPAIGSRASKHWFLLRHKAHHTEQLLSMLPRAACPLSISASNQHTIRQVLSLLHHPYLDLPEDVDITGSLQNICVIQAYRPSGSLKDLLHRSECLEPWVEKYFDRARRLPLAQIQIYARQLLEVLVYLKESGLPPLCHLNTANITITNYTCKLAGVENTLLSLVPRRHVLTGTTKVKHIDVLSLGHVIYEMGSGLEMNAPRPRSDHLVHVNNAQVTEVIRFIFNNPDDPPSATQLLRHSFFRDVHLKEMDNYGRGARPKLPTHVKAFLKKSKKLMMSSLRGTRSRVEEKCVTGSSGSEGIATTRLDVELQPRETKH